MAIDYLEKIPNNVDITGDRRLQRALENWQPEYLKWWDELGPVETADTEIYLRTAISVDKDGWAHYGFVKMPEYRWGIFLAPPAPDRMINFGIHKGQPAWTELPGEYRAELRRLVALGGPDNGDLPLAVQQPDPLVQGPGEQHLVVDGEQLLRCQAVGHVPAVGPARQFSLSPCGG